MEGRLEYGKVKVHYVLPKDGEISSACYVHGTEDMAQRLAGALNGGKTGIFSIGGEDWNADLSPWKAPAAFAGEKDFAGGAGIYLDFLCRQVVPQTEHALHLSIKKRGLIGYSMAGLFSVYALYYTGLFTEIASVSGSLWYDGFLAFVKEKDRVCKPGKVYFSVGKKEKKTRNARMARVEDCTRGVINQLEEEGVSCFFEMNEGNHFYHVEERMEKAIRYLFSVIGSTP